MKSEWGVLFCHLTLVWLYDISPHYFINGTIFGGDGGNVIGHKMCVSIFSKTFFFSETFLILRRMSEEWSKMCIALPVKYPLFLSDFNEN